MEQGEFLSPALLLSSAQARLIGSILSSTTVNLTDLRVILLLDTGIEFTRNRYSGLRSKYKISK